ncbi:MAG: hypothetical protein GY737_29550 [Desulfobacteraceae bacterium]|nr:hypothetical protein [Desulfobacteraceae bacterium]
MVSVTAINKTPPPAVTGLKVNVGRTRVRLSWQAMEFPVAGFQVERQMPNGKWFRLNRKLSQENVYNDYYGRGNGSVFRYRVKAIAFDQQEGAYCESPEVKIEDMRLPPAPRINRASGKGGLAVISFSPAHPEERSRQFLLLRGRTADEPGVVMGDPLPAGAREFTDSFVAAGKSYWYHVVALDKRGNRSNYSRGVKVTVGLPPVPVPSAPKLIFLNKPFTHVRLEWEDVPEGFLVVVERRKEGDTNWRFLMGDLAGKEAMDMHPPRAGKTFYRILYRTVSGEAGKPSGVTVLQKK